MFYLQEWRASTLSAPVHNQTLEACLRSGFVQGKAKPHVHTVPSEAVIFVIQSTEGG